MSRPALNKYPDHVRSVFERVEGTYVNHCIVTCGVCGVPRSWPRFPAAVTAKYLLQRGYLNPLDPRRCACPQCAAVPATAPRDGPVSRVAMAAAMAAPPIPANLPKPKPKEKPMKEDHADLVGITPKAAAPRVASPADNQRIKDTLHAAYDEKRHCYTGGGNDAAMAEMLKVPRSWVADVRKMFFGDDICAAKLDAPVQLTALQDQAKKLESDAMDLAARAEALGKKIADVARAVAA